MVVNITNMTGMDSLQDMAQYANTSTNGVFWGIVFICIFVIFLMNMRRWGTEIALAAASFSCLLLSSFATYLGWLTVLYPVIFGLILVGAIAFRIYHE